MRSELIVGVVGMFGLMGCATSGGVAGALDARAVAVAQAQGVRAGEAQVVDMHINPRVPVHVTAYQLMAQAWTADGSALGHAVVVSPEDSDVLGAPKLVKIDAEHAVATFAATLGDRFELLAVPLEVL